MATFAVIYRYTDDAVGRDEHRAAHRTFLNESGWTLLSGPLKDPDGALILVEAASLADVEENMGVDPFYTEGLVAERVIREFSPVGGKYAETFAPHLG